nr:disulfide isomerase DsbC N-terminal domain-containing protein [Neisseria meningitidis]
MASIYEVTMGDNIAYVQENGRYFIFGALYDMQEQKDLTEMARSAVTQKSYSQLPFKTPSNRLKVMVVKVSVNLHFFLTQIARSVVVWKKHWPA